MSNNIDETEPIRRALVAEINSDAGLRAERAALEQTHGKGNVWNTQELGAQFEVLGFLAPFCVVKRRSDGVKGSVLFQHDPRFYFGFQEDR